MYAPVFLAFCPDFLTETWKASYLLCATWCANSLCKFLQPPFAPFLLGQNILHIMIIIRLLITGFSGLYLMCDFKYSAF